jgi:hypothetical protein
LHLQLLLLYGIKALGISNRSLSKDQQVLESCIHRNILRTQLYQSSTEDLLNGTGEVKFPLHRRWLDAHPALLAILTSQVMPMSNTLANQHWF